ncbi:hypothetical protein [Rhodococcus jostii]|uniref:hypothetical protein n=1 Tax=Rhodococcus jostii TaxID=132919 RepID=UPI0036355A41
MEALGHDPSVWRFAAPPAVYVKLDEVSSRVFTTYRYKLEPVPQKLDMEALVTRVRAATVVPEKSDGSHWFVFQAGDQQIGKRSRDGSTEQIVERYLDSVQKAAEEFGHLKRHGIAGIQISLPGDCLEGVVSQGGKNLWLTQETITEQTRILRRLMLHTVEAFAPLTDRVYLDVINGNHDESQRMMNTYPGDGWATECAIAVQDALKMNDAAYGHVEVRVPDKWSGSMTVPVGDTAVTVVHGHQWSRGKGMTWLRDQDFGHQAARGTQVLQHGHIHTWELETTREVTRVASPTYDCGSDWFREVRGGDAKRGGLAYLLRAGEVSRMSLV